MKFKSTNNKLLAIILLLWSASIALTAQSSLLYFEAQGIYGYSSETEKLITYSHMADGAMQKPSFGIDWLQRFPGKEADLAVASLQFRLSYNEADDTPFEPQLYNAWLKLKTKAGDVSLGHLKPASGLSYVLDNHALLLPDMTMYNMTYDRDWGGLYSLDTPRGNLSASVTTASGMKLYNKRGNYLLAARVSYGVLGSDNYTVGATLQKGQNLIAKGYDFHTLPGEDEPMLHPQMMAGLDGQFRHNNLESALDVYVGEFNNSDAWSILWRNGVNLLPENRLKLEGQGIWRLFKGKRYVDYSAGLTFKLNADLALRAKYNWQDQTKGEDYYKLVGQIYYYKQLF